jgi:hypothetical protein
MTIDPAFIDLALDLPEPQPPMAAHPVLGEYVWEDLLVRLHEWFDGSMYQITFPSIGPDRHRWFRPGMRINARIVCVEISSAEADKSLLNVKDLVGYVSAIIANPAHLKNLIFKPLEPVVVDAAGIPKKWEVVVERWVRWTSPNMDAAGRDRYQRYKAKDRNGDWWMRELLNGEPAWTCPVDARNAFLTSGLLEESGEWRKARDELHAN